MFVIHRSKFESERLKLKLREILYCEIVHFLSFDILDKIRKKLGSRIRISSMVVPIVFPCLLFREVGGLWE